MMYEFLTRYKTALISLVFVVLIAIVAGAYLIIEQSRSGISSTVYIVPADAVATIDGQPLKPGNQKIPAGDHDIVVRKYGFTDYQQTTTINDTRTTIDVALIPESGEAIAWAEANADLYRLKESRASKLLSQSGKAFSDDNPIVSHLPIDNMVYTIGYRRASSDPTSNAIIIEIDAIKGYRNGAIQKIKDLGFNPAEFTITFRDYRNPFSL